MSVGEFIFFYLPTLGLSVAGFVCSLVALHRSKRK